MILPPELERHKFYIAFPTDDEIVREQQARRGRMAALEELEREKYCQLPPEPVP
jgi:hypothetical protein